MVNQSVDETSLNVGLASLVIQASGAPSILDFVPKIIGGLRFLSEVINFEESYLTIRNDVLRAHERLATWAVVSGWVDGKLAPNLEARRQYIEMTLVEIVDYYTKINQILDTYTKSGVDPNAAGASIPSSPVADATSQPNLDREYDLQHQERSSLSKQNSFASHRRYLFASSHRDALEGLVRELYKRVCYLNELLNQRQLNAQGEIVENEKLAKLLNLDRRDTTALENFCTEALRLRDENLARTATQVMRGNLVSSSDKHTREDEEFAGGSIFRPGYEPFKDMMLSKDSLKICRTLSHDRELGILSTETGTECRVLVENRQIKKDDDGTVEDPRRVMRLQVAIDGLCYQLAAPDSERPTDLRTLRCVGYLIDSDSKFRMAFTLPDDTADGEIVSLYDLMQHRKFPKCRPSLESRLELALKLAKCLLRVHAIGWFHKELRSSNIIFVQRAAAVEGGNHGPGQLSIDSPYLAGFDQARPGKDFDLSNEYTERENAEWDKYRHPNCTGGRTTFGGSYRASYDVHSLGVVLTEIGHWATVSDASFNRWAPRNGGTRAEFHQQLMMAGDDSRAHKSPVNALAFRMGQLYTEVVRKCLTSDFDKDDGLLVFRRDVVAPLIRVVDSFAQLRE